MDTIFLQILVIVFLIILNGFFACSEFAIISIRKSRIAQLVSVGNERAKLVEELQSDPHRLLAVVQVGVTLVGSLASAMGGIIAIEHIKPFLQRSPVEFLHNGAQAISIGIMVTIISYVSLVLGELVPKSIGLMYADTLALQIIRPLVFLGRIASLFVSFLSISSKGILWIMGIRGDNRPFITREEVQLMVSEGHESGIFTAAENEFIQNIFDFTHTSVREVMVPRTRMAALDLDFGRDEMLRFIVENQYSRYPVYRESIESVEGFIHGKDFLGKMVTDPAFPLESIIRPPFYVPEGKKVNDLLKEMQRQRIHMALVVDEYGGISGLVTTEDLLEELVGEIEDEHDIGEPRRVETLSDGSLRVDALISVNDLKDLLHVTLPDSVPYDTVAGLILDELGRFPERGEQVLWNGYLLTCEEVKKNAIVTVRIEKKGDVPH
ncbi:hemolysin family protein [Geobacter argillaceus]|uniref:Putative hemolysin n=1 Tax=Geobacter argillaceus TaxID=345631 RepID=A0A562V908_9BACT|nr:hemolysin family protein [Geobacter argillaceus]TWJ14322.1 putative hemolysin [Geobacter argillaceus]